MPANPSRDDTARDIDAALMHRLLGDDLALNAIMDRWSGRVASFIYKMTGSHTLAEELAQETFVKLYQARARYKPSASFSTYLFAIAANLVKNHHRWARRHPEVSMDDPRRDAADLPFLSACDSSDPRSAVQARETLDAVLAALFSLPVDLREAITLAIDEGMSHGEIAKTLGCTPKAVEARIYRARQILKTKLSGISQPD